MKLDGKELKKFTLLADILICATNKVGLITEDMVQENCVVIYVGSVLVQGKVKGNVCDQVEQKVIFITPVPGGIGPLTVAMFLENVLQCYYRNR